MWSLSSGMVSKATPLSAILKAETSKMEVLFSPFVGQRLAELSADLCRDVDGNEVAPLGDCGLSGGKPLPKPKARMDAYRINWRVFNFAAATVGAPLKVHDVKEVELVSVLSEHAPVLREGLSLADNVRLFSRLLWGDLNPSP